MDTDVQRVRQVLARELETISHYESLAAAAESQEIRAFFLHLAEEEKEHVAEAVQVLRRLDPAQDQQFQKPFTPAHFEAAAKPAPGKPEPAPAPAPERKPAGRPISHPRQALYASPAPPSPHGDTFTVGSLRGNNA